jgi:SnoaL-like domain
MPACLTLPEECAPQNDDSLDPGVEDLVKRYVDDLWNYEWTDDDHTASRTSKAGGGPPIMPPTTAGALNDLIHQDYTRHRRDGSGDRKMEAGVEGLIRCIDLVHEAVTDLKVTILDIVACGDCVAALLTIEGQDLRPDGQTEVPGLFGAARPTGRRFRIHTAVLFCLEDGLIKGDYLLYGADLLFFGQSYVGHNPQSAA